MTSRTTDDINTLYLDEHLRAIHKPHNLAFHSEQDETGLVSRVRAAYPNESLFPIHRLDRMTSGLMIFARSQESNRALSELLAAKQVEKYYLAVSGRKPAKKQGTIIGDMKKGRGGSYLLSRDTGNPAVTRFFNKPLELDEKKVWLFVLKPETGKTHQLRVAMKSMGCAILGDARYGQDQADRGYLHAYKMRFELFGQRYELVDEDFCGDRFDLQKVSDSLEDFTSPERLPWSKKAFRLDE